MTVLLWIASAVLIAVGVAGTVVPVLPGAVLVFGGIFLGAWIDGYTRIPPWLLVVLGVLAALASAVDYVAAAAGAKRAGASRLAIVGATLGTLAGILSGLWGLLFFPLIGAFVGQFLAQRDVLRAGHVGLATWVGLLVGGALKLALVLAMVGIFAVKLLF